VYNNFHKLKKKYHSLQVSKNIRMQCVPEPCAYFLFLMVFVCTTFCIMHLESLTCIGFPTDFIQHMWTVICRNKKQDATDNSWGEAVVSNHSAGGRIFDKLSVLPIFNFVQVWILQCLQMRDLH
jgi:hypothetical protein